MCLESVIHFTGLNVINSGIRAHGGSKAQVNRPGKAPKDGYDGARQNACSFAIFAAVIQGSVLFVVLGLVFLATGLLFDRARRKLARTLEEA